MFETLNQGEISQIKGALKSNFKPTEIVIKQEKVLIDTSIVLPKDFAIDTYDDVKSLVFDYHANSNLSEKIKETMAVYLKDAWSTAEIDDVHCGGKFHIKKMEFDNMFGYGEGNIINFDATEGITGIFGKNASGKSSICGALSYGFFNGTDRGALKNLHVINERKNFCNTKITFSKSGIDYLLERQTVKVVNKKGETWAPTELNLFELDENTGEKKDLSEEQRRETEKTLRALVGNLDDFLLTTLSSQGNINKFIDLNGAARKSNLAKFLKLDIFDQLNDALKDELSSTKKMLESVPEKQYDDTITLLNKKILEKTSERQLCLESIDDAKVVLEDLQSMLSTQSVETYTKLEVDDQEKIINESKKRLLDLEQKEGNLNAEIVAITDKKNELLTESGEIDQDALMIMKEDRDTLSRAVDKSASKLEKKKDEIDRDKAEVKKLSDVPCGDSFPTCKYIVSARTAKTSLEVKTEEFTSIKSELSALQKSYNALLKESIDERLKDVKTINEKITSLNTELSKMNTLLIKNRSQIDTLSLSISSDMKKLDRMKANLCDESVAKERESLISKKKNIELDVRSLQSKITNLSEVIGTSIAELAQTKREKEEFEIRSHKNKALKNLSKALSKNGIPLNIVRQRLPQINAELSNILQTVAGFTIELESDEESSDMEIYLNYGDSRRIIETASGMEKLMSSIALRAALINISSLPRPDIFIIDEGFGALEGKHLEACVELVREITKYFKSIIVI